MLLSGYPYNTAVSLLMISPRGDKKKASTYIEHYCRRNVNTLQTLRFDQKLDIIRDCIAAIQAAVFIWLV